MRNMKKYLACLVAAMMMCGAATACGGNSTESSVAETEATTEAATEEETTEAETEEETTEADEEGNAVEVGGNDDVQFEEAKDAESGQAYLAIVDGQWWIQYWGSSTTDGYMLSYDAGVVDITGNGQYTVSVTADTNGFRYDTTGDVNDQYVPNGLSFMAVMIKDGENTAPGAVITIDSIVVDGNEIPMSAKNYTSSDDGVETRSNIYNSWVNTLPEDARSTEGNVFGKDGDYSAQIVDPADFSEWTTVEVNFTVSGLDGEAAPAADEDAEGEESAAEDEAAEETAAEETAAE